MEVMLREIKCKCECLINIFRVEIASYQIPSFESYQSTHKRNKNVIWPSKTGQIQHVAVNLQLFLTL